MCPSSMTSGPALLPATSRDSPVCHGQGAIGDTLETRNAAHVHDVGCSFAFDNVRPVQVNAEGATAVRGKLTQLRCEREGLPMFFFFRPARKDLLDAKEPASDPVNLAVAAVVRVVALSKHGLTATIHVREFRQESG